MIRNIKLIIVTTICLLLITICANTAENKILFKVNNQIITSLDILTELDYLGTINKEIKKHKLNFDADTLLDFAKRATEAREKAKFEFSKSLSKALELIVDFGSNYGINRENVAFLNYNTIIKTTDGSISSQVVNELFNEIENNKKKHLITSSLKLPALITSANDVDFFFQEESEPNFVTQLVLDTEIVVLDKQEEVDIEGKLVLIENTTIIFIGDNGTTNQVIQQYNSNHI